MSVVRAKKHLGQHFLTDKNIASKVALSCMALPGSDVLEIGPGTGMLTAQLLDREFRNFKAIEIDDEAADFLQNRFSDLEIIRDNFLTFDLKSCFPGEFSIVGNFPYNISSQIFFRVLENREIINEVTGMIQKEVAERIVSGPGTKVYGILSVLLQTYYDCEYLFTVSPAVFSPPPKVKSAVIRLIRKDEVPECFNEKLFFRLVKLSFNQRRKTIRNSIKSLVNTSEIDSLLLSKRPEQLGISEFIELTGLVEESLKISSYGQDN